jgi:hypothetical protein
MPASQHPNPEDAEMATATDLAKMVPGFDFLQGLLKNASAGLPPIGQWIAPTLDPEELGKRINELRTVQMWLEQNAKLTGATIQALEVQRMTLATLKQMNLPMADLRDSLKAQLPSAGAPAHELGSWPAQALKPAKPAQATKAANKPGRAATAPQTETQGPAALVDPMQWWGALTQQFTELAGKAVRESGGELARNMAGAVATAVVQQGVKAAGAGLQRARQRAAQAPGQMLKAAAGLAQSTPRVQQPQRKEAPAKRKR